VKSFFSRLVAMLGYEIRSRTGRATLRGVLENAWRNGVRPASVLDVGAAYGQFTRTCASVFPQARHILVEPLEEYRPLLDAVCADIPGSLHVAAAAAAATASGEITINVHPDLVGSSAYLEDEDSDVNGVPRTVPTVTLDDLIRDTEAKPPFLIKVDVQGAELDVLEGAGGNLEAVDLVILEVSFFKFFKGAPQFATVIAYMEARGFVPYDVFGLSHRPVDGALAQADVAFVKADGPCRAHHHYATAQQRAEFTRRLSRSFGPPHSRPFR
jgi:FkbM family methyltransferase